MDREKIVDALRNCINKPKCQNCSWKECNTYHETFELPKGLVMDAYDLLKDPSYQMVKYTTTGYEKQQANIILKKLQSTLEDMRERNNYDVASYLLRLIDEWEKEGVLL